MSAPDKFDPAPRQHARRVLGLMVAALGAAGLIVPLALLLPAHPQRAADPRESSGLSGFGIAIDLPDGWQGTITYPTGALGPVLQATNFPLPDESGDFYDRTRSMPATGVAIVLQELAGACGCSNIERETLPFRIDPSRLVAFDPHAYETQVFQTDRNAFVLYAEFGSTPVPDDLLNDASGVLSTVTIDEDVRPSPSPAPESFYPAPSFSVAEGWNTVQAASPGGSGNVPIAWAANTPFSAEDFLTSGQVATLAGYPGETLRSLPTDGVVIVATLPLSDMVPVTPNVNFPSRELPLLIGDAEVQEGWEGQPAANVPLYLILGVVNDRAVDVRIYFGTVTPSGEAIAAAQEELDRLVIPPAP